MMLFSRGERGTVVEVWGSEGMCVSSISPLTMTGPGVGAGALVRMFLSRSSEL